MIFILYRRKFRLRIPTDLPCQPNVFRPDLPIPFETGALFSPISRISLDDSVEVIIFSKVIEKESPVFSPVIFKRERIKEDTGFTYLKLQ